MKIYKCDKCGQSYEEEPYLSTYILIRDGVGSFYSLEGHLDLCPKCMKPILKEIFSDLQKHLEEKK